MLHQHCPLSTLVLFFRTLSLCRVLWSECSTHTLSARLKSSKDERRGTRWISMLAKHITEDCILFSLPHSSTLLFHFSFCQFIPSSSSFYVILKCTSCFVLPLYILSCLLASDFAINCTLSLYSLGCFSPSSHVSPLGQGASWDHPAGESKHQGGGGAQET